VKYIKTCPSHPSHQEHPCIRLMYHFAVHAIAGCGKSHRHTHRLAYRCDNRRITPARRRPPVSPRSSGNSQTRNLMNKSGTITMPLARLVLTAVSEASTPAQTILRSRSHERSYVGAFVRMRSFMMRPSLPLHPPQPAQQKEIKRELRHLSPIMDRRVATVTAASDIKLVNPRPADAEGEHHHETR
jgi:hypothetical protein